MIYNGALEDKTNFISSKYLEINSCNIQYSMKKPYTVIREQGRVDYHLLYVAEGECLCLYEGEEFLIKKGEGVIYPPQVMQKYTFREGVDVTTMWVHFSGIGVSELLLELGLCGGVFRAPVHKETEHYFKKMIYSSSVKNAKHRVAATAEIVNLLASLAETGEGANSCSYPDSVTKMLEYVNSSWQKGLTVTELAAAVHLSESRAAHLFKEAVGKSIHSYVSDLRISAAKELLLSTELSVKEVGEIVGIDDPLYFSRAFKLSVGLSPKVFREK